jgi:hypothetical protein
MFFTQINGIWELTKSLKSLQEIQPDFVEEAKA